MNPPSGKGIFVWLLDRCAGGDPVRLAAEAVLQGFSWVVIKVTEAKWRYQPTRLAPAINTLRLNGIKVWGYGFVYGAATVGYPTNSPTAEAHAAVSAVTDLGLDGWVIDAESAYKRPGASAWARSYMAVLRPSLPDTPIALCSYRYPTVHPQLPWADFLRYCDLHMPQVYWLGSPGDPGEQLARSVRELGRLKDLPVVPVGSAYREHGREPTVIELDMFDMKAKELGLPGVTWWSWQHAEARPEWWRAIATHHWGPPGPIPLTLEQKVAALWDHHPELWSIR